MHFTAADRYAAASHSIRDGSEVALTKAGVDFTMTSRRLSHPGLSTTMRSAPADLDMKRQARAEAFPELVAPARDSGLIRADTEVLAGMRKL